MSIDCKKDSGGKIVCKFESRMDTTRCMVAEKKIMEKIENVTEIVFDLSGVEYIASSFLRLSGKALQKVGIAKFSIINVSPMIKKVFKIAGLTERLNVKS